MKRLMFAILIKRNVKKATELAEKFKNEGNVYYEKKDYPEAIKLYSKAIGKQNNQNIFHFIC